MFLELTVNGNGIDKGALGFLLGKHPASSFEKSMTLGRVVRGKWVDGKETSFSVTVDVASRKFIETLRQLNFGNYTHAQQNVVCPFTLSALREVFSSVFTRKYHKGSTRHDDLFACECTLGPWPCSFEFAQKLYFAFGIDVNVARPYVFKLVSRKEMTVSEFVQKVFTIANLLTNNLHIGDDYEWKDKVATFISFAKLWPEKDDVSTLTSLPPFVPRMLGYALKKKENVVTVQNVESINDDNDDENEQEKEGDEGGEQGEEKKEKETENKSCVHEAGDNAEIGQGIRTTLHERRHMLIAQWAEANVSSFPEKPTFIDYGCSDGSFTAILAQQFPSARIFAVDASENAFRRLRRNKSKNIVKLRENLLYPRFLMQNLKEKDVDLFILSEVIEHLEEKDRKRLIEVIAYVICPKRIAITTPNKDYNKNIKGLCANGMRHQDHRIEYNFDEWQREVVLPLAETGYAIESGYKLVQDVSDDKQPSFCGFFTQKDAIKDSEKGKQVSRMMENMFTPIELKLVRDASVVSETISAGLIDRAFLDAGDDAFFFGPTIAPVEHTEKEPDFLEHPRAAFDYYRERGAKRLMAERKYMGSRAHVLVFRDRKAATEFGWPENKPLILVISRSGRAFFSPGGCAVKTIPSAWEPFFQSKLAELNRSFAILDAEIMPWTLKSGKMINNEYRRPGEYALETRKYAFGEDSEETKRAKTYLDVLNRFDDASTNVVIRVFNVLASCQGFRGDTVDEKERYTLIDALCQGGAAVGVVPVERFSVDLSDETSMQRCVDEWIEYCKDGRGEGFVMKASPCLFQTVSGDASKGMLQPMLKVRGRDYLRLIYGMDYLTKECFDLVKKRRIGGKRLKALKQWEVGSRLLEAFISRDEEARIKYFAAICGEDAEINVDKTL